jgi:LPXTG-motif cell wall-anchored protein
MKRLSIGFILTTSLLLSGGAFAQESVANKTLFDQLEDRVHQASGSLATASMSLHQALDRIPRFETGPVIAPNGEHVASMSRVTPTETTPAQESAAVAKPLPKKSGKRPLDVLRDREDASGETSNSSFVLLGLFLVTIVVFSLWMKRRRGGRATLRQSATIETIATNRVFGKHAISLVRVPGRVLVLGSTDKGMSLLTEISEEAFNRDMMDDDAVDAPNEHGFASRLQRLYDNFQGTSPSGDETFQQASSAPAPIDELLGNRRPDERGAIRERLSSLRAKA